MMDLGHIDHQKLGPRTLFNGPWAIPQEILMDLGHVDYQKYGPGTLINSPWSIL
jgi:hypothetical protein